MGVSGPGGVEVEAERGGRGGFSSSPSNNHRTGALTCDQTATVTECKCPGVSSGDT